MAQPTSYTEATLKSYMDTVIGEMADVLGWTVGAGDFDESLNDALNLYGEQTIGDISGQANIQKLRALARVAVWRNVKQAVAAFFNFRDPAGAQYSRAQLREAAEAALVDAESEAMANGWLDAYEVDMLEIEYEHDPYGPLRYDEQELHPTQ